MSKYAVEVTDVKKSFFLPNHKNNSLKQAITQAFKPKAKGGKTFNALDGISFNVEKGDFFGILGRNGSGKSTLLKIISEIYQPTSGNVKHDGKLVSFIELGVGFKPELSGRENVFLNGGLLGFSKKEVEAMYDEIVSFAELEPFMDQKLKNYSSGMKVRLAFSVAIRAKADILILDEVLAVGDAAFRKKCSNYFKTLKEDHKTVILVTHGMADVREYCNRAIVIENGKIIYEGEAEGAAEEYTKLFAPKPSKPKEKLRWGTKDLVFDNVKTLLNATTVEVVLSISNKTREVIENVNLNVDVYDSKGRLVGGIVSSKLKEPKLLAFNPSVSQEVSVSFDNIFGGGEYSITVGLKAEGRDEPFDLWKRVGVFTNNTDVSEYFPIFLPATVNLIKEK